MYSLKEYEIEEIKKFLEIDSLDDEIFNNYFVKIGTDIALIYSEYVYQENSYPISVRGNIATLEEFKQALELKLEDRFYCEINRYIKFSDGCVYYINDNTLLG